MLDNFKIRIEKLLQPFFIQNSMPVLSLVEGLNVRCELVPI